MMKTNIKVFVQLVILIAAMIPMMLVAQPMGPGPHNGPNGGGPNGGPRGNKDEGPRGEMWMERIPDLTDAQKDAIKDIHTKAQADILPLRNQINEKEARLQTLQTAKTADMKAINSVIDEIATTDATIKKRRAQAHQDVRKLLNDEQRLALDMHFQNGKMHQGKGRGQGGRGPGGK